MDLTSLEKTAFTITFGAYLIAAILYIIYVVNKSETLGKIATAISVLGLITNTVTGILLWKITGHPPLSSGYEYMISFTWAIVLVYIISEFKFKYKVIGAFVLPTAWLILSYIILFIAPEQRVSAGLNPALQSNWLHIHVATAIFSYSSFAIAMGVAIMYLIKANLEAIRSKGSLNKSLPSSEILDDLSYKFIAVGFPLLSLVIITGAIWAEYAWGRYWSWDPKETWSLITWFVYAAYLHTRLTYGWKGKRAALVAVIGFAAVLFTLLGVNYLGGLHSYGRG